MAYDEFTAKMIRRVDALEQAMAEKDREIARWKARRLDENAKFIAEAKENRAQMKPKKLDRFERVATENIFTVHGITGVELVTRGACAYLLRSEHAWMRQMVKKVDAWACQESADNEDVIVEILRQLEQRRK